MMRLASRTVTTGIVASLAVLTLGSSFAEPPETVAPDPELRRWFEGLRQPRTGRICCSVSDCRFVAFTIRDGHYEVLIEGRRYVVPNEAILKGITNPTDKAVACYDIGQFGLPLPPGHPHDQQQDTVEILCFVPPQPPS
jgi:hypothetical protein